MLSSHYHSDPEHEVDAGEVSNGTADDARSSFRPRATLFVIALASCLMLGHALRMPSQVVDNDVSRWCTVWSLLERGTYAIDDCPWRSQTNDKVRRAWGRASKSELATADELHFYSSKPPLLATMIAGVLYPARAWTGVPLDAVVKQRRVPRPTRKDAPDKPGGFEIVEETPPPIAWPVYIFYFKPIVILLNLVPYVVFLALFARFAGKRVEDDFAWLACLVVAAFATLLTPFLTTLNNHTIAAFSAAFALFALLTITVDGRRGPASFAVAGFFGAFCACNELPAALFGVLLFVIMLTIDARRTFLYFVPAAAIPCIAFLATQYVAVGDVVPVYSEFGTKSYNYEGSYWNTPLELDAFDKTPEPRLTYLFHITLGHHGFFALTPILLLACPTLVQAARGRLRDLRLVAALAAALTVAMFAFYTFKTHNYGGSTQGPRWLFWIIPFWLFLLPDGLAPVLRSRAGSVLVVVLLGFSLISVGYGLRNPWSNPWILDMLEHLNLYNLPR